MENEEKFEKVLEKVHKKKIRSYSTSSLIHPYHRHLWQWRDLSEDIIKNIEYIEFNYIKPIKCLGILPEYFEKIFNESTKEFTILFRNFEKKLEYYLSHDFNKLFCQDLEIINLKYERYEICYYILIDILKNRNKNKKFHNYLDLSPMNKNCSGIVKALNFILLSFCQHYEFLKHISNLSTNNEYVKKDLILQVHNYLELYYKIKKQEMNIQNSYEVWKHCEIHRPFLNLNHSKIELIKFDKILKISSKSGRIHEYIFSLFTNPVLLVWGTEMPDKTIHYKNKKYIRDIRKEQYNGDYYLILGKVKLQMKDQEQLNSWYLEIEKALKNSETPDENSIKKQLTKHLSISKNIDLSSQLNKLNLNKINVIQKKDIENITNKTIEKFSKIGGISLGFSKKIYKRSSSFIHNLKNKKL